MQSKLFHLKRFVIMAVLAVMLFGISVGAASPSSAEEPTPEATSQVSEEPQNNSTKQWIFFAVTSVLSLAVAIPLAIRSGNKKYGK